MIITQVIHGSAAVKEYERTGKIPTEMWLDENGCSVSEKKFNSMAEYQAYIDALEENDGYDDWRMLTPTIDNHEQASNSQQTDKGGSLYFQLQKLHKQFVDELRALPLRPEGWLPHIVYVEEEGDYPVYTMYKLEEIREDGSCVLFNPETQERFTDRHLYEINIDWLDTVLRWYKECCIEQNIWKEHAKIILNRKCNAPEDALQEFVDTLWQKALSDEENIALFNERQNPNQPAFEKNDLVKLTDEAIATIRECFGDEAADYREDMILKVQGNKLGDTGIWMTDVRDINEDDIQEFRSSMLRAITTDELRKYVLSVLDKY